MNALVIGGTGPSGPLVVRGLIERGYRVTVYHRGYHETDVLPPHDEHLHGNADDREELERDVGGREWDLVCAMYGRNGHAEEVFAGRCSRLIHINGQAGNMRPYELPFPQGNGLPVREDYPRYRGEAPAGKEYGYQLGDIERRVMVHHAMGDYAATVFRYANMYGPYVARHALWPIVRRVLAGRPHIIVPGDGSFVRPMCFTENAAHMVLLAVDRREAAGHIFNSVDSQVFFMRDIIRIIAEEFDRQVEVVGISHPLADDLARAYVRDVNWLWDAGKLIHVLGYSDKVPPAEAIRRTARWQSEHRELIDEELVDQLTGDPLAYDIEDKLVASFRSWSENATATIPAPPGRKQMPHDWRSQSRPKE